MLGENPQLACYNARFETVKSLALFSSELGKIMIGILLITHEGLGQSLLACARHILQQDFDHIAALSVEKSDDPDAKLAEAEALVSHLDSGEGVLVLSDMCGGTPSNVASKLVRTERIAGVAGVSLPMLVRVVSYRHLPLAEVLGKAITGGLEGVMQLDVCPCVCGAV